MDFSEWTLETIREFDSSYSWLEEVRFNWVPQAMSAVSKLLEGSTIIVVTDSEFKWYGDYIVRHINKIRGERPFVPAYKLCSLFPQVKFLSNATEFDMLFDMLDISFPNGYIFWYVGSGDHNHYEYIEQDKESMIWRLNKEIEGYFSLNRKDPKIDIKLIQSFELFDRAISAGLFGEVEL
ncbi:MAG TPA: hypothetical protein ENK74_07965 [Nitratifractor sp.]|nr:hypothetical protein [Nitratifractor sp.]